MDARLIRGLRGIRWGLPSRRGGISSLDGCATCGSLLSRFGSFRLARRVIARIRASGLAAGSGFRLTTTVSPGESGRALFTSCRSPYDARSRGASSLRENSSAGRKTSRPARSSSCNAAVANRSLWCWYRAVRASRSETAASIQTPASVPTHFPNFPSIGVTSSMTNFCNPATVACASSIRWARLELEGAASGPPFPLRLGKLAHGSPPIASCI